MSAATISERPGFEVEETADSLLITFPNGPRIGIGRLLAELTVFWLAYLSLLLLPVWISEISFLLVCWAILTPLMLPVSASLILWNYLTVDRIKVDSQWLELQRGLSIFRSLKSQRFQVKQVKKLRPVQPSERVTAMQHIFGLRLIFLNMGGPLAVETSYNMTVYIGWGASKPEVEQVIALIQQRFPQYGQLA
jgi:hypothetical protein